MWLLQQQCILGSLVEDFASHKASVVVLYPNSEVVASGWLKGEDLMARRAAVVSVEMNPGRSVLFGLRPQHRAQTRALFRCCLMLFIPPESGTLTNEQLR